MQIALLQTPETEVTTLVEGIRGCDTHKSSVSIMYACNTVVTSTYYKAHFRKIIFSKVYTRENKTQKIVLSFIHIISALCSLRSLGTAVVTPLADPLGVYSSAHSVRIVQATDAELGRPHSATFELPV